MARFSSKGREQPAYYQSSSLLGVNQLAVCFGDPLSLVNLSVRPSRSCIDHPKLNPSARPVGRLPDGDPPYRCPGGPLEFLIRGIPRVFFSNTRLVLRIVRIRLVSFVSTMTIAREGQNPDLVNNNSQGPTGRTPTPSISAPSKQPQYPPPATIHPLMARPSIPVTLDRSEFQSNPHHLYQAKITPPETLIIGTLHFLRIYRSGYYVRDEKVSY